MPASTGISLKGFLVSASGRYSRDSSVLDGAPFDPGQAPALERYLFDRISNSYQFTLRLQKRFGWGRSVPRAATGPHAGRLLEFGSIAGLVFNDLDLDGLRGRAEPGVPKVAVRLDGETLAVVGSDGTFDFGSVEVGPHTVELELVTVPASYDLGPGSDVQVEVTKGSTVELPFALLQLGKIRGAIVVVDRTDEDEEDANIYERLGANLAVRLTDGHGVSRVTMSDEDGEFEFTSLPANEYRLSVDATSLPDHWTVLSEEALTVSIKPGGRAQGLKLAVTVNPRPTRRIALSQRVVDLPSAPPLALLDSRPWPASLQLAVTVNPRPTRRSVLDQRVVDLSSAPPPALLESRPWPATLVLTRHAGSRPPSQPADASTWSHRNTLPAERAARVPPVVAVVPFTNISTRDEDAWLGVGLTESLLTAMAMASTTRVIDIEAFAHGASVDTDDIERLLPLCRELGTTVVVSGGVQRVGQRLRITVRLVDVETGTLLHTVKVDGGLDEVFALQDRIATELTGVLSD